MQNNKSRSKKKRKKEEHGDCMQLYARNKYVGTHSSYSTRKRDINIQPKAYYDRILSQSSSQTAAKC